MKIDGTPYRTIWLAADGRAVEIIDQTKLPHAFVTVRLETIAATATAIRDMWVRGAPLLGVNGIPIICHGSSPPKAIESAIYVADRAAKASMVSHFIGALTRPTESGSAV